MSNATKILAKGDLYIFYRPKVETEDPSSLKDVQRFFMVLKFKKETQYIVIALGKKKFPNEATNRVEFAFVEHIAKDHNELLEHLNEKNYSTLTQGDRHQPSARAIGEGKFLFARHANLASFDYELHPQEIKESQAAFNIAQKAHYLVHVKNPKRGQEKGLNSEDQAKYSEKLLVEFKDYKFIPLTNLDYLNYQGAELLFIDDQSTSKEFADSEIEKSLNSFSHTEIEKELKSDQSNFVTDPIETGKWC